MAPLPHSVMGTANFGPQIPIDPNQMIHFAVTFNVDTAGLQNFVDQVSNPNSPLYRQFMTPTEVGEQFGAAQADIDSTVSFLQNNGFTITMTPKNRTAVFATGTVAQIERAFGTKLTAVQRPDGTTFHTNLTSLNVPASLVNKIHGIRGVDNFIRPVHRTTTTTMNPPLWQIASHDNVAYSGGYQGQGRNIAITNWDGYRLDNLTLFYSYYGLPLPPGTQAYPWPAGYTWPKSGQSFTTPSSSQIPTNVHIVKVDANDPKGYTGYGSGASAGEGDLDQQNVLMSAPLSNLYIYDDNIHDDAYPLSTYDQISDDNIADVVTESYGWPTYGIQFTYNSGTGTFSSVSAAYFGSYAVDWHTAHLSMSAQGITYMAATGDDGTYNFDHMFTPSVPSGTRSGTYVDYTEAYPDIDPEVLAVGGEVVTITTPNGPVVSEVPWAVSNDNNPFGGTGGFDVFDTAKYDTSSTSGPEYNNYTTYDSPADAFTFNAAPTYQKTYIPTFANSENYRLIPDLVAPAGGAASLGQPPAYIIFFSGTNNGTTYPLGSPADLWGTSCASPAVAGALSVFEQRLFLNVTPSSNRSNVRMGRIADLLYSKGGNSSIFNDITSGGGIGVIPGTSITANPAVGWDYATGWGSLNFQGLYLSFFTVTKKAH